MSNRSRFLVALAVTGMTLLGGCSASAGQLPANCKKVEPLDEYQVVQASYVYMPESDIVGKSELIFKGIVIGKSEYAVEAIEGNQKKAFSPTAYVGIIEYKVTDVLYSASQGVQVGGTVRVITGFTSHRWTAESIDQEEGKAYIILARKLDRNEETNVYNNFISITDFYLCCSFRNVIPIIDNEAEFHSIFTSLVRMATLTQRITPYNKIENYYVMAEDTFISEMKKLVEKYKAAQPTNSG
jgi:hypothetical protein